MLYFIGALLTVFAVVGLLWFFSGFIRMWNGRVFNGVGRCLAGLVLMLLVACVALLALDLRTYVVLTYEKPIAIIRFKALGDQYYEAWLDYAGGKVLKTDLHGDEWQLDARVIKWRGIGTLLGLHTRYRLERLSGRYRDVAQERTAIHSAVSLVPNTWPETWSLLEHYSRWLPWMDASYGSATYLPMADGAEYRVSLSTTGLLARPDNAAARQALVQW